MKRLHADVWVKDFDASLHFYSQLFATMAARRPQVFIRICK